MTPLRVFRTVAIAEAISWAGLLGGMVFKYGPDTALSGELGVKVFGPIHGVVFIAFCLVTVLVAVNQEWSRGRTLLGLASSIPPFATVPFDRYAEKRGLLDAHSWRDHSTSDSAVRRGVCWLLAHYRTGALILAGVVAALTGLALLAGPPVG